ncbi:MAG: hypothetical protein BZY87_10090 [SAR202 cluster bacterium Io17-Chloro-G6]|nr:MAG: hypothetical protein BZY87_10090 [SAR202 cluster bacterium Io17-Chloro-G6]
MSGQNALNIRTFKPADLAQVHELFVSGLMEFAAGVEQEVRSYVDHSLSADLSDIPGHYLSHPRANFWVAESDDIGIAGMVGIQPTVLEEEAELRRMSVSSSARRQGIGRRLLDTTEVFCREKGYQRICLSTVGILQPALAMYRGYGYKTVKEEPYGDPPNRAITVHYLVKGL